MSDKENTISGVSLPLTAMKPSTVTWCGTAKQCLTDVEKAILYHKHEANRSRFFGMMKQEEYHTYMAGAVQRMVDYSERTKESYENSLRKGL